jgi:GNAT superfamily N-acetyltransferase
MPVHFEITSTPNAEDVAALIDGLVAFNDAAAERQNRVPLAVFARKDGKIIGGAYGASQWRWLFINYLWVDSNHRKTGLGTQLIETIERAAKERGCIGSHLDTFSFQALGFYQRLGYKLHGTLRDYPPGHSRHYLFRQFTERSGENE